MAAFVRGCSPPAASLDEGACLGLLSGGGVFRDVAHAPARVAHDRLVSDVVEPLVLLIAVEHIGAAVGQIQVQVPAVVVVCGRASMPWPG